MTAELAQVPDGAGRWRFAAGWAHTAVLRPRGGRASAVVVAGAGALAVVAVAATALATGAVLPAGRVFTLVFVGLVGGLATVTVARRGRAGGAESGPAVAVLALVGVAACVVATIKHLAEYPPIHRPAGLGSR
jgi:hypothetical protein